MLAMGARGLIGKAANGKKINHPDNDLFPSKRGAMLTLAIAQLAITAGSFAIAELKMR